MENGKRGLTSREKLFYQQIHPAKLSVDISVTRLSGYLVWIHQLILGLLAGFIPAIIASELVVRYANLDRYAVSPLGKYVAKYMTRNMQAVRTIGLLVFWFGAWYQTPWIIVIGLLIVLFGWIRGKLIP